MKIKKNEYESKNIFKSILILVILLLGGIFLIKKGGLETQNLIIFILVWGLFIIILSRVLIYNIRAIVKRNHVNNLPKKGKLQIRHLKISGFSRSNRGDKTNRFYIYDGNNKFYSEYFDSIVKNYDWETSEFLEGMGIVYCPLNIQKTLKQMENKPTSDFEINGYKADLLNNIGNILENKAKNLENNNTYTDYDDLDEEYKINYEETEETEESNETEEIEENNEYKESTLSARTTNYNRKKFQEIYDDLKNSLSNKNTKKPYMKLKNGKNIYIGDSIDVYIDPQKPNIYQIDTNNLY